MRLERIVLGAALYGALALNGCEANVGTNQPGAQASSDSLSGSYQDPAKVVQLYFGKLKKLKFGGDKTEYPEWSQFLSNKIKPEKNLAEELIERDIFACLDNEYDSSPLKVLTDGSHAVVALKSPYPKPKSTLEIYMLKEGGRWVIAGDTEDFYKDGELEARFDKFKSTYGK